MNIDLIDVSELQSINKLKEVTDPILFIKDSSPSPNGLVSREIFGSSPQDRKDTFAYISLNGHFLHPFIYKLLKRLDRKFDAIIHGNRYYVIQDGLLVEDEDNGETGLDFLYNNWDKIIFEKNNSNIRNERIDVLSAYKRDQLFVDKWVVIPAFYRDVNMRMAEKGILSHHIINDMYAKLIRYVATLKSTNAFTFTLNATKTKVQMLLVDIYNTLKERLHKKHGMIRKNLLGKSIDYGSRLVISAPEFNASNPDEMMVNYYNTGIPLAQCCTLFYPFISNYVKNFFTRELERNGSKFKVRKKDGTEVWYPIKQSTISKYTDIDLIKKQIDNFILNHPSRFDKIEVELDTDDKVSKTYLVFRGRMTDTDRKEEESPLSNRPMTWTDVLYQAAYDVLQDKHVYITRYPLLDYFGTYVTKISISSTTKTVPMYIGDRVYTHYPYVDLSVDKSDIGALFTDTAVMSNLYLYGIGGDYDGDQVTVKGLYSQEANLEAEKIMKSKSNVLNIYGENMRQINNEGIQTLYTLTK